MGTDDALLMDGLPGNLRHADGGRIGGQDRREGAEGFQLWSPGQVKASNETLTRGLIQVSRALGRL